jgi:hypothetical protein
MDDAKKIEDITKWKIAATYFKEHGYSFFQCQYDVDSPEGFHAWFINPQRKIEVYTFDQIVRDEIVGFK